MINQEQLILRLQERFSAIIETYIILEIINNTPTNSNIIKTLNDPWLLDGLKHRSTVVFYSYIYSLFDTTEKSVNYFKISDFFNITDKKTLLLHKFILNLYSLLKKDLIAIRHNIGFHYSEQVKSIEYGYKSFHNIDEDLISILLESLGLVFRYLRTETNTNLGTFANTPTKGMTKDKWFLLYKSIVTYSKSKSNNEKILKLLEDFDRDIRDILKNESII